MRKKKYPSIKIVAQKLTDRNLSRSYPPTPKTKSMSTIPCLASLIGAMQLICCQHCIKNTNFNLKNQLYGNKKKKKIL